MVVWSLTLLHPTRVNKVICLSLPYPARATDPGSSSWKGDLAVYVAALRASGFTGGINWYRNLDRDWHLLADVDPIIHQPALMIDGDRDPVARSENLADFVPGVEETHLDSGHWIQQEKREATNRTILEWRERQATSPSGAA